MVMNAIVATPQTALISIRYSQMLKMIGALGSITIQIPD